MFDIIRELLPGCYQLKLFRQGDARGAFTKTFHDGEFRRHGIDFVPREVVYTSSVSGVVRGMHFQLPPHANQKLVHCANGRVLDVLVDLRMGSPAFGQAASAELSAAEPTVLYIPIGVAHGFAALEPDCVLMYQMDTVYNPKADAGVRWNSFGFAWPVETPVISARDQTHPPLKDFQSPFEYNAKTR